LLKRPGRDLNPGRRSDSPPYWTGFYDAIVGDPNLHLYTTRAYLVMKFSGKQLNVLLYLPKYIFGYAIRIYTYEYIALSATL
jgi:hypothetical protein